MTTQDPSSKIPCSVEILTRNSATTLERCLESVKDFAEIIILDGNSMDRTLEIAQKYGCRIYKQYDTDEPEVRIKDYAEVRNKGLRLATYDWFLYIDSDEYLSKEAVEEIRSIAGSPNPEAYVWWQPRKYVFQGKIIECATTYPNRQIRFFCRSAVKEFTRPVHERVKIKEGERIGYLKHYEYVPLESFGDLRSRWEHYLILEKRALDKAPRFSILKKIIYTGRAIVLYAFRFLKFIFCRGVRLPLIYELGRQWYNFRLLALLVSRLIFK